MTSPLHNRERVDLARSFRTTVFPVGQPVVVRIANWKLSSENRAAVRLRYFPSADAYSSRVSDDWPGGLNPSNALPAFFDRTRGNNPVDMNFWRALRAWSFGFLVQPAKQSRSRFTQSLKPLSFGALHESNLAKDQKHEEPKSRES
jgi:hypothetical protein